MNRKDNILKLITVTLLLLWIPVSIDKLANFSAFKAGILRQPFSDNLGWVLIYSLPVMEVAVVLLLLFPYLNFRSTSLKKVAQESVFLNPYLLSSLLMLAFTAYIGIALLGAWEHLPCGCGSVISWMSWRQHFWFNLLFLSISIWGLYLSKNKRLRSHREQNDNSITQHKLNTT